MKDKTRMEEKNGKLKPNEPGEEKTLISVRRNSIHSNRPNFSQDADGFILMFQSESQILTHHIQQLISVPGDSASDRVQFSEDQPCVPGDLVWSSSLQETDLQEQNQASEGHKDRKNMWKNAVQSFFLQANFHRRMQVIMMYLIMTSVLVQSVCFLSLESSRSLHQTSKVFIMFIQ